MQVDFEPYIMMLTLREPGIFQRDGFCAQVCVEPYIVMITTTGQYKYLTHLHLESKHGLTTLNITSKKVLFEEEIVLNLILS